MGFCHLILVTFSVLFINQSMSIQEEMFSYTGQHGQEFSVPERISTLTVKACGSAGAGSNSVAGGLGGCMTCIIDVQPGSTLFVLIGGKGHTQSEDDGWKSGEYNGGGTGAGAYAASGGGASDVRTNLTDLSTRLVVGGAGGGSYSTGRGGAGGGLVGGTGTEIEDHNGKEAIGGAGGSQLAGGQGGTYDSGNGGGANGNDKNNQYESSAGQFGAGGSSDCLYGGGGGGGFFGGGGGCYSGGGGGSSFCNSTILNNTQGETSEGYVLIQFDDGGESPSRLGSGVSGTYVLGIIVLVLLITTITLLAFNSYIDHRRHNQHKGLGHDDDEDIDDDEEGGGSGDEVGEKGTGTGEVTTVQFQTTDVRGSEYSGATSYYTDSIDTLRTPPGTSMPGHRHSSSNSSVGSLEERKTSSDRAPEHRATGSRGDRPLSLSLPRRSGEVKIEGASPHPVSPLSFDTQGVKQLLSSDGIIGKKTSSGRFSYSLVDSQGPDNLSGLEDQNSTNPLRQENAV